VHDRAWADSITIDDPPGKQPDADAKSVLRGRACALSTLAP
jgi:hypothetical protein